MFRWFKGFVWNITYTINMIAVHLLQEKCFITWSSFILERWRMFSIDPNYIICRGMSTMQTSQNGQKQTKENNVIWLSRIHYKKKQIWIPLPVHQISRCIFELCAPTKVIVGKYLSALHKIFCVSELDKVKCSQFFF